MIRAGAAGHRPSSFPGREIRAPRQLRTDPTREGEIHASGSGHDPVPVRPAVVVSAAGLLRRNLATVFVVPCTTTYRNVASHVELLPDELNGLSTTCWAQVDQLRPIARARCVERLGNVGVVALGQMREIAALLIDTA